MSKFTLDTEAHQELTELLEDTIEYWCNEHMISGELAWTVAWCLATAKVEMFKGNVKWLRGLLSTVSWPCVRRKVYLMMEHPRSRLVRVSGGSWRWRNLHSVSSMVTVDKWAITLCRPQTTNLSYANCLTDSLNFVILVVSHTNQWTSFLKHCLD